MISLSRFRTMVFAGLALLFSSGCKAQQQAAPKEGWQPLFAQDLSNTIRPEGVWSLTDGVLTATEDQAIWSKETYENFELKLEFKNDVGSNSGVFIYGDVPRWINYSVEIQIADDHDPQWANSPKHWQCGAIFGHQAAVDTQLVHRPGIWNTYHIIAKGPEITVFLNDRKINHINMKDFTSTIINPDGSEVPEWISVPKSELPTKGHIGFQGKHAGKPIWFRNIQVKSL
ncbi:DUF1080 domain-containing protein [Maribacter sp. 2307ULW6-5]|uniref:3-keto-disaccharide hydrolase n=1 Tax=Maribacter sp. 2307ULW6-5 TaxID=3386275 RepID=UPI0039BC5EBA